MIAAVCLSFCLYVHAHLVVVMGFYIYLMISFGLMQPGLTATALDAERKNAGAASAIFGAAGFLAGGISSPIIVGKIEVSSSIVMIVGALLCLLLTSTLQDAERARKKK